MTETEVPLHGPCRVREQQLSDRAADAETLAIYWRSAYEFVVTLLAIQSPEQAKHYDAFLRRWIPTEPPARPVRRYRGWANL